METYFSKTFFKFCIFTPNTFPEKACPFFHFILVLGGVIYFRNWRCDVFATQKKCNREPSMGCFHFLLAQLKVPFRRKTFRSPLLDALMFLRLLQKSFFIFIASWAILKDHFTPQ